ncbi:hypothetical protein A2154_02975 [Candidatus Gottesmanbacteria bacterium RBG_16_43_7]|uniref:Uncharacterized protein n=1 Tax=Candidatus Gottesmanbacteria bacterium RBG_16_43_7 TaxID=1798373 RepID=A0A1F5Z938_9BACT|nr:MAG: hypothetical protein A2154_02975 [Candidatus Gottesmanbacteria bacterium RBG_16_43_7]
MLNQAEIQVDGGKQAHLAPDILSEGQPIKYEYGLLEQGKTILFEHQQVTDELKLQSPYFATTGKALDLRPYVTREYIRNGLRIETGPIKSFFPEDVAVITDSLIQSYIEHGTFRGSGLRNSGTLKNLTGAMIDGYDDPERLIVAVFNSERTKYIGGCMITRGQDTDSISSLINNQHSHLPTISALTFSTNGKYSYLPESVVSCPTRFSRLPNRLLLKYGIVGEQNIETTLRNFSMEVLSNIAITTEYWQKFLGQTLNWQILDTHDPDIVKILTRYYGGEIIDASPRPNPAVDFPNPLAYHYQTIPGITVIGFERDFQMQTALQVDKELGLSYSMKPDIILYTASGN